MKIVIAWSPILEIEDILTFDDGTLRIDSAAVGANLSKFI